MFSQPINQITFMETPEIARVNNPS